MNTHYEVVIVGAGSAGLAALREVKKRTQDFLLVNDGPWGTTCARVGCMPSKVLIEAANAYHRRGAFEEFGIRGAGALSVDLPAVLRRVRRLRDGFLRELAAVPASALGVALAGAEAADRLAEASTAITTYWYWVPLRAVASKKLVPATGVLPLIGRPAVETGSVSLRYTR